MYKLRSLLDPIADESLLSHIVRTAEENCLKPDNMAELVGTKTGGIVPLLFDRSLAEKLAPLLGLTLDEIQLKMYLPLSGEAPQQAPRTSRIGARFTNTGVLNLPRQSTMHSFFGTPVNREDFYFSSRRFAPGALAEGGYHRASWDIDFIFSNRETGEMLQTTCGYCKKKPNWRTKGVTSCTCKEELRHEKAIPIPEELRDLSSFLHGLIDPCSEVRARCRSNLPRPLRDLSVSTLVDLMATVGHLASRCSAEAKAVLKDLTADRRIGLMLLGYQHLAEWPGQILPLIEQALNEGVSGSFRQHLALGRIFPIAERAEYPETKSILLSIAMEVWAGSLEPSAMAS